MSNKEPWQERWEPVGEETRTGGQGETLRVNSREGGRLGILKKLENQRSDQARSRMSQEVLNLRILHAAGCKVPEVLDQNTEQFEDKSVRLYFVMECIKGPTLADVVAQRGGLDLEASVGIVRDLGGTMQIALESGVIHRDLKPDNVIVRSLEPPDVVTVDYGPSFNRAVEVDLTRASETLDNEFLSLPERRVPDGDRRDPRSDLTGLCGVFLFCLTGQRPVDLRDSSNKAPHRRPGCSIRERVADAPRAHAVEAFFDRGFAVSIEDRFQTITEFLERLDEILDPKIKATSDDPVKLAQRFSAQLLREDRKTQIASFARGAQFLIQTIEQTPGRLGAKLGPFVLDISRVPGSLPQAPGTALERSVMLKIWNVHHTDIAEGVAYEIRAQGTECILYRAALTAKDSSGRNVALKGEWEPILHYDGFGDPPGKALVADDAVESVITMLRNVQERILKEPQA